MIDARTIHDRLLLTYGPQRWWPAESPFEVIVGAVLVQRTTWNNAERAIAALKAGRCLDLDSLAAAPVADVEDMIRSAGFFRVKAKRLKSLVASLATAGGLETLAAMDTARLRSYLLGIDGIGAETADSILLYAFDRPTAVIDAYLRRIWTRLEGSSRPKSAGYDRALKNQIESALASPGEFNELHALLVEHGKRHCRSKPRCGGCALAFACRTGREMQASVPDYSDCQVNPSLRR